MKGASSPLDEETINKLLDQPVEHWHQLRDVIVATGLSQNQMAKDIGESYTTINHYLRKEGYKTLTPNIRMVLAMLKYAGFKLILQRNPARPYPTYRHRTEAATAASAAARSARAATLNPQYKKRSSGPRVARKVKKMPYSYSAWSTWNKCPAKYKYSYIDRLRMPQRESPQMQRGTAIHESVEKYIKATDIVRLHDEIHKNHGMYVERLKVNYQCHPEYKWAFDGKWNLVDYDSKKARIRGVLDLLHLNENDLGVHEWKTGKPYEDHLFQNHLYGMSSLLICDDYDITTVTTYYFDQKLKDNVIVKYNRDDLNMMKITWEERLARIDGDVDYNPNPNYLCRYCEYSKANGGPCPF